VLVIVLLAGSTRYYELAHGSLVDVTYPRIKNAEYYVPLRT
jgi:hypothetical protein